MADEGEVFPYYKVYFKLGDYNSYNLILLRFPYYKVYFKLFTIPTISFFSHAFPYYKVYFKQSFLTYLGKLFIYFHTIKSILNKLSKLLFLDMLRISIL